jgi:NADH-quinone oxidoreductase subunit E
LIDLQAAAPEILSRYPEGRGRSALLPLLRLAQERDGYLTQEAMAEVAGILGLTTAEVASVATFYTMFHLKPKGHHVVSVCHNLSCNLWGAEDVIAGLQRHLGVECGHTTSDGEFTLERAECLAACDLAPVIQVDYDRLYPRVDSASAIRLLEELRGGAPEAALSEQVDRAGLEADAGFATEAALSGHVDRAGPEADAGRPHAPRHFVPSAQAHLGAMESSGPSQSLEATPAAASSSLAVESGAASSAGEVRPEEFRGKPRRPYAADRLLDLLDEEVGPGPERPEGFVEEEQPPVDEPPVRPRGAE